MSKGNFRERLPQLLRRRATTHTDSTFGRLRKVRNDHGNAALIGVLVALAITGLMLSLAGPAMLDLVRGARDTTLRANFQTAVSVVEARLQQDPAWLKDADGSGADDDNCGSSSGGFDSDAPAANSEKENACQEFIDILTADASDFNWTNTWTLEASGDDQTINVQFLRDGTSVTPGTATAGPTVPYLLQSGSALRLQASNSDGVWVCALLIARPQVGTFTSDNVLNAPGTEGSAKAHRPTDAPSSTRINGLLGGVWFDTGTENTTAATHCDPSGTDYGADNGIWLPHSAQAWYIATGAAATDNIVDTTKDFTRKL